MSPVLSSRRLAKRRKSRLAWAGYPKYRLSWNYFIFSSTGGSAPYSMKSSIWFLSLEPNHVAANESLLNLMETSSFDELLAFLVQTTSSPSTFHFPFTLDFSSELVPTNVFIRIQFKREGHCLLSLFLKPSYTCRRNWSHHHRNPRGTRPLPSLNRALSHRLK